MKRSKKALLAAGLLIGSAALTGCSATTAPVSTPTPGTAQQATAQPDMTDATPTPSESPQTGEETTGPIGLRVDGEELEVGAVEEEEGLFLPLEETGRALGWDVKREEQEEEALVKKSVQMEKDGSQITVSWVVSDNTTRQITWQKDGLLIPVDAQLTTVGETVYAPAAFFEKAMRVTVDRQADEILVATPAPQATQPNDAQSAGEEEEKENR